MKRVINGQVIEFPRPDQIQIFTNCIEMLLISLRAQAEQHHALMKPYLFQFYKGKRDLDALKNDLRREKIAMIRHPRTYDHNERDYSIQQQISQIDSELDKWHDNQTLKLHKKLLDGLMMLLSRVNYFEELDIAWTPDLGEQMLAEQKPALDEEVLLSEPTKESSA